MERSVRRHTDYSKRPPVRAAGFSVAPASISSRFLCPRPPLLPCAPNQSRHATQATKKQIQPFTVTKHHHLNFSLLWIKYKFIITKPVRVVIQIPRKGGGGSPPIFFRPCGPRFGLKIRGWPATSSSGHFSEALEVGPPPKPPDFLQRVCSSESHEARLICFSDF